MDNNLTYNTYAMNMVRDVPRESLSILINLFMNDAAIAMGNDFNDGVLDMVIENVKSQYSFIPICYIGSAFKKGSMGKYGPGRLVPRTIMAWLEFESIEYNKYLAHKTEKEKQFSYGDTANLHKYPLGSAINKKLEWFKSGKLDMNDWDKIPLKEMAERIAAGLECVPEIFGVKSLNLKNHV